MRSIRLLLLCATLALSTTGAWASCGQFLPQNLQQLASALDATEQKNLDTMTGPMLQKQADGYAELSTHANGPLPPQYAACLAQAYRDAASQKMAGQGANPGLQPRGQAPRTEKAINTADRSAGTSATYPVPPAQCVSLKVEGESVIAVNHCGMPIVGQFCFRGASPQFNCSEQIGSTFGPLNPNAEAMIATTAGVNPGKDLFVYDICNNDAADHNQCHPHHP